MKIGKFSFLLMVLSLSVITISACSPDRVLVEDYDQVPAGAATTEPEAPEESVPEPVEDQGPAPVEEDEGNNLDDVPIMDEAYQVQKGRSGKNVVYQVDASIEEVVTYYQEVLPNYEWELVGPPDNAVASIATMLRENADGDRLAINLQANELGGFVRVNITISRAN
jgi:hypothetical protein